MRLKAEHCVPLGVAGAIAMLYGLASCAAIAKPENPKVQAEYRMDPRSNVCFSEVRNGKATYGGPVECTPEVVALIQQAEVEYAAR